MAVPCLSGGGASSLAAFSSADFPGFALLAAELSLPWPDSEEVDCLLESPESTEALCSSVDRNANDREVDMNKIASPVVNLEMKVDCPLP